MMNKYGIGIWIAALFFLQQCKVMKVADIEKKEDLTGMQGYELLCLQRDTIHSLSILKADALITFQGDRYEAKLSLFHYFDSSIFVTAVSSGYEVLRGSVDKDSIILIDRLNKTVYRSAMHKRFGYQHPLDFSHMEMLTSRFGCCAMLSEAVYLQGGPVIFDLSGDFITRKIYREERNFTIERFDFIHTRSNKYLSGERTDGGGLRFYSNIMFNDFEILAYGGELSYNQDISIDMKVNTRKYSFINL